MIRNDYRNKVRESLIFDVKKKNDIISKIPETVYYEYQLKMEQYFPKDEK